MSDAATGLTLDPATTAVVLIEYQNDFTTEGERCTARSPR